MSLPPYGLPRGGGTGKDVDQEDLVRHRYLANLAARFESGRLCSQMRPGPVTVARKSPSPLKDVRQPLTVTMS